MSGNDRASLKKSGCDELTVFQLKKLSACAGLQHGFCSRQGGHSLAPFASLNVGASGGDEFSAVEKNRAKIETWFGTFPLVFVKQVHQTGVVVLKKGDALPEAKGEGKPTGDALVTDRTDILLGIKLADCQAVLLYDPVQRVAANIHSGWRGSAANIIGETVRVMEETFQVDPAGVFAGISPSLGPCCAEFVNYRQELPRSFWLYKDDQDHFDFWEISRQQLIGAGIPPANIDTAGLCTRCHPELFYSYRRDGRTGRFAAVIGLKE